MKLNRKQFAAENQLFRCACRLAGLAPSRHQAGRWRKQQGTAWRYLDFARAALATEEAAVRFPLSDEARVLFGDPLAPRPKGVIRAPKSSAVSS